MADKHGRHGRVTQGFLVLSSARVLHDLDLHTGPSARNTIPTILLLLISLPFSFHQDRLQVSRNYRTRPVLPLYRPVDYIMTIPMFPYPRVFWACSHSYYRIFTLQVYPHVSCLRQCFQLHFHYFTSFYILVKSLSYHQTLFLKSSSIQWSQLYMHACYKSLV